MKNKSDNFFARVYDVVCAIPRGSVMNYGTVASLAGNPRASRVVGYALHNNPDPDNIPCHRVVFRDGSLSPAFAFGGANQQKALLVSEGVAFNGDKVIMKERH